MRSLRQGTEQHGGIRVHTGKGLHRETEKRENTEMFEFEGMRIYVLPRYGRLLLRIFAGWLVFVGAVIVSSMVYTVVTGTSAMNQWLLALLILSVVPLLWVVIKVLKEGVLISDSDFNQKERD